jgi:hypothetical protein
MISPPSTIMPLPVIIIKRGVSRAAEAVVTPVIHHTGVLAVAINSHVSSESHISLPVCGEITASIDSGISFGPSLIA